MLRGKLNSADLHDAMSIDSSIIESVRMLDVPAPASERESEPDISRLIRPSSAMPQPARSIVGQARGVAVGPTLPELVGSGEGEPLVPGVAVSNGLGVVDGGIVGGCVGLGVKLGMTCPLSPGRSLMMPVWTCQPYASGTP